MPILHSLLRASLAVGLAAAGTVALTSAPASAAEPVLCTPDALVVSAPAGATETTLGRLDITGDTPVLDDLGPLGLLVNAIGYNPQDGLLYGLEVNELSSGTREAVYVQFGEDAGAGLAVLGTPVVEGTGEPLVIDNGPGAPDGVVDADGNHLLVTTVPGATPADPPVRVIVSTDVDSTPLTASLTPVTGLPDAVANDYAFNAYDGRLYGIVGSGRLQAIDPETGVSEIVATTGAALPGNAGGAWSDSTGALYFYANLGGDNRIVRVDPTTSVASEVVTGPAFQRFDATACLPPSVTKSVSPETATVGETVTFTFTLRNATASTATVRDFTDVLPDGSGLEWADGGVDPASPGGGTVDISADGSTLTIDPVAVPSIAGGPLTITADALVTEDAVAGTYTNQASMTFAGQDILSDEASLTGIADPTPFEVEVPVVPVATDDTDTTPQGQPVTVSVLDNDAGVTDPDPASLRLVDPVSGELVTTVTVDGEGTYTLTAAGEIVFTPVPGFTGVATPVDYSVAGADGQRAVATLTITVTPSTPPAPPVATDDERTVSPGGTVTIDPLDNDTPGSSPLDPTTVRLLDPMTGEPVTRVVIPGEGTYSVDTTTGLITFTAAPGFAGVSTIDYVVADEDGNEVVATITITVPPVTGEDPDELAMTGASVLEPVLTGLGLLLVGGLLVVAGRRRRLTS